jgi:hypothetical protein
MLQGMTHLAVGIAELQASCQNYGEGRPGNDSELTQLGNGAR